MPMIRFTYRLGRHADCSTSEVDGEMSELLVLGSIIGARLFTSRGGKHWENACSHRPQNYEVQIG
jgi:hypothetical protein